MAGRFTKSVSRICSGLVNISSVQALAPWLNPCSPYYPCIQGQTHPLLTWIFAELSCSLLLSEAQSVSIGCASNIGISGKCLQLGKMNKNISALRHYGTLQEVYSTIRADQQGKTASAEDITFPPHMLWRLIVEIDSGLVLPTECPLVAEVQYVHSRSISLRLVSLFIRIPKHSEQGRVDGSPQERSPDLKQNTNTDAPIWLLILLP